MSNSNKFTYCIQYFIIFKVSELFLIFFNSRHYCELMNFKIVGFSCCFVWCLGKTSADLFEVFVSPNQTFHFPEHERTSTENVNVIHLHSITLPKRVGRKITNLDSFQELMQNLLCLTDILKRYTRKNYLKDSRKKKSQCHRLNWKFILL